MSWRLWARRQGKERSKGISFAQCSHIRTECSYQIGHSNLTLKVEQSLVISCLLLHQIVQRGPQVHVLLQNIMCMCVVAIIIGPSHNSQ